MVPSKVIHIREARRRLVRAKKKNGPRRAAAVRTRVSAWWGSGTTKGTALITSLITGLLTSAVLLAVLSAPQGQF